MSGSVALTGRPLGHLQYNPLDEQFLTKCPGNIVQAHTTAARLPFYRAAMANVSVMCTRGWLDLPSLCTSKSFGPGVGCL